MIVQMIVGGMTQYLTAVQGMPTEIEIGLSKLISKFIWKGGRPTIQMETLFRPREEGGLNVLDLKTRNKAIDIMWLKSFLDISPARPKWAYIADILIGECVTKSSGKVDQISKLNTFLQTWDPNTSPSSKIPHEIIRMLKIAKRSDTRFDALRISQKIRKDLPAWFHIGASERLKKLNNSLVSKCLRQNHEVKSIGDLLKVRRRTMPTATQRPHRDRSNCACCDCKDDRERKHCKKPNKCVKGALAIIHTLSPLWDPHQHLLHDGLSLTERRKDHNKQAIKDEEAITIDPSTTLEGDIAGGFRIFSEMNNPRCRPALRRTRGLALAGIEYTAYTDGSSIDNGLTTAIAGAGVWFGPNHRLNQSFRLPQELNTNQAGEVVAILLATRRAPTFATLHIRTDSKSTVKMLTEDLDDLLNSGFIGIPNGDALKATIVAIQKRSAPTTIQWVKGHARLEGNEAADKLASLGVKKSEPDNLNLRVDPDFNLTGAKLASVSQAFAYRTMKQRTPIAPRRTTTKHIREAQEGVLLVSKRQPVEKIIWRSIWHKDLSRQVSDFLWKSIHGSYKCGPFWKHVTGLEDRGKCNLCNGEEESMEHILTKCQSGPRTMIWRLTEQLWRKKYPKWPTPNFGTILGIGSVDLRDIQGCSSAEASRLYRILTSESAYLIWRMRCERRIRRGDNKQAHTPQEIKARWYHTVNKRLQIDRMMTSLTLSDRAIDPYLVRKTWSGILDNESRLPDDWIYSPGVLVGIQGIG